jgi:hypothetical protein
LAVAEPIEGGELCQIGRYKTALVLTNKKKVGTYFNEHRFRRSGRCFPSRLCGWQLSEPVLFGLYLSVAIMNINQIREDMRRNLGEDSISARIMGVKGRRSWGKKNVKSVIW